VEGDQDDNSAVKYLDLWGWQNIEANRLTKECIREDHLQPCYFKVPFEPLLMEIAEHENYAQYSTSRRPVSIVNRQRI
jgi:hypothetical protein